MSQPAVDMQMDVANLYREDSYTDRKLGVIRCMTPVTPAGETDTTRPILFMGQAEIMTSMGPVPINFEIEGSTLGQAVANFADAAQKGIQHTVEQINEMRRQQSSQLVVAPGNMPGLKGDPRGGGGKIQLP